MPAPTQLPRPGAPSHLPARAKHHVHAENLSRVLRGSLKCSRFDRRQIEAARDWLRESAGAHTAP